MSLPSFDPRPWNLFVSAALMGGCSTRLPSDGADSASETTDDPLDTSDSDDPTAGGPECYSDADCSGNYYCLYGYCEFDYNYEAGECLYDAHCGAFEICQWQTGPNQCVAVGEPPPECEQSLLAIPTVLDARAAPLALSFADVDADGDDELVVATATELLVYPFGNNQPAVSERAMPSEEIRSMVAGQLDAQSGEDLVLLLATGQQHRYFSDGAEGFTNLAVEPSPILAAGLLAGNFDGQDPSDLLIWGPEGAVLDRGADTLVISDERYPSSVAAFEASSPYASFLIGAQVLDLMGAPLDSPTYWGGSAAAIASPEQGRYALTREYYDWIEISQWNLVTATSDDPLFLAGLPTIAAGDFDGDQHDELVAYDTAITLIFQVFAEACAIELDFATQNPADAHAIGDHDGDGDDELALRLSTGAIAIIDGE